MKMKSFAELYGVARQKDAYRVADAIYSFTEELNRLAELEGVSRVEIARRLGTSAAYVTKIFRGDANFTVESMVRLARAVGARLHVHIALEGRQVRWFELPTTNLPCNQKESGKKVPPSRGARNPIRQRKHGVSAKGRPH